MYQLGITLYRFLIHLVALFSKGKVKDFVEGRKNLFTQLKTFREAHTNESIIWIHAASLGEFEQGRPIIEAIKAQHPTQLIVLTFFSPSGYNIRHNYAHADFVSYMPIDTKRNAQQFVDILSPDTVIFIKYEFWLNHLNELSKRKIPHYLVSAKFRKDQLFFKAYGNKFKQALANFTHVFVQDQASRDLLSSIQVASTVTGDTRVDRVVEIAKNAANIPLIDAFVQGRQAFVIGSSWPQDEALLIPLINQCVPMDMPIIIAPHEIDDKHVTQIEKQLLVPYCRYSDLDLTNAHKYRVIIINNIGMLSALYQYGKIAYIGGGLGKGIHNTLEPAAFGLPIIFGPKHQKFPEAVYLAQNGGAFSISTFEELKAIFESLLTPEHYQLASQVTKQFIQQNKGATAKVLEKIGYLTEI